METEVIKIDGIMHITDPVYNDVHTYDNGYVLPKYMTELFETKEMLRLKDIKQTGYSSIDIPGLKDHNRYGHSIGVAYLMHQFMQRMVDILEDCGIQVDHEEVEIAELVMGAHDIGHTYNSHQSERVLKYSHESRTVDILLGDTEIGNLLRSRYPKEKLERVIHIITQIDINQGLTNAEELSPILQLYAQAVSSGFDLDKIDYTVRDSKYAGIDSRVDPLKIINSFEPSIDEKGRYCLAISEEAQRQCENLGIERFQNYRDMYFNQSDEIMANVEPIILSLAGKEPEEVRDKLSPIFLRILEANESKEHITSLQEELQMTDTPYEDALRYLTQNGSSSMLRYLCNPENVRKDYKDFTTARSLSELQSELQAIFPERDLSDSKALFECISTCKMIKPKEDFWVRKYNGDLEKATHKQGCLIRLEEFSRRRVYFNSEILRLELGMTKEEFSEYGRLLKQFIDGINEREEFQAKYLLKDKSFEKEDLIALLRQNGFVLDAETKEQNEDDYFESKDLELLKSGQELRIRRQKINDAEKTYVTYKTGINTGKFTHRKITRQLLDKPVNSLEDIEETLGTKKSEMFTSKVEGKPFLHASTDRTRLYFVNCEGEEICISWDDTVYNNNWLQTQASDTMLEIECVGESQDRLILKGIEELMEKQSGKFSSYAQSKVARGAKLTYLENKKAKQEDVGEKKSMGQERELKIKFEEKDREKIEKIIEDILDAGGYRSVEPASYNEQTDTYYDTKNYDLAKAEESARIRKGKGKLVATYKSISKQGDDMFSRQETEAYVVENTALALILAMDSEDVNLPEGIRPVVQIDNKRIKEVYDKDGISIEVAFDKLTNTNLQTQESREGIMGEAELEFGKDINEELVKAQVKEIWLKLLRKCTQEGIKIEKSTDSKYVRALKELGLIPDKQRDEASR